MHIAICIATFRRPRGLQRLLQAIADQVLPHETTRLSIIVVDNDAEGSAVEVCAEEARTSTWPLIVLVEPQQCLARARNVGLRAASEAGVEWLAFIDDDEVPRPTWLAELIRVQQEHDADVVGGAVVPHFPEPVPHWVPTSGLWQRPRHPTGHRLRVVSTANALVRLSCLEARAPVFDERFGLMGGEDEHLFRRLHRDGARTVWADEAVVDEWMPASRCTARWLVLRKRRVGAATALMRIDLDGPLARPALLARAAVWVCIGFALAKIGLLGGSRRLRLRGRMGMAYARGLAAGTFGGRVEEYREIHGG